MYLFISMQQQGVSNKTKKCILIKKNMYNFKKKSITSQCVYMMFDPEHFLASEKLCRWF